VRSSAKGGAKGGGSVAMNARTASAHYYLGRIAEQQGDCTGALRHYIKVRRGDHRFDAELRAAVCMAEVDRIDEARLHLQRLAARYRDDQPSARITLTQARVERIAGDPDRALDIMGNAVERRPDSTDLRYNRALMAAEMDRFELARSDLRAILEREPDNARALNALGYMLADRDMQLEEARSMIERALEQNPEDAATLDSMGWVLFRLGQPREALE
jgi:tetratricopeptide (TPR) repeat protein